MEINEEDIRKFFRQLGHEKQTEVRAINNHTQKSVYKHCNSEDEFVEACKEFNGYYNVYVGIHERAEGGKKKKDVISIKKIPFDIDRRIKDKETPPTQEDLDRALEVAKQIKNDYAGVSLLMFSGGGCQGYFSIPKIVITDDNRKEVEDKLKAFGEELDKKYSTDKVQIDLSVYDLSRIMRVPGTLNIKYLQAQTLSKIIEINDEESIELSKTIFEKKGRVFEVKEPKATPQQVDAVLSFLKLEHSININDYEELSNKAGERQGAHPFHESSTGTNFNINTIEQSFNCWHDGHGGGGPIQLYAISKGIINCGDELKGDNWHKAIFSAIDEFKIEVEEDEKDIKKSLELEKNNKLIEEGIVEYFTDSFGVPYATISVNQHYENWKVFSSHFRDYVIRQIYQKTGKVVSGTKLKDILNHASARAKFEGSRKKVHLRAAHINDAVYIDLCNDNWEILKVTKDNITKTDANEIKFQRQAHMKELKVDLNALTTDLNRIFKYIEILDEKERVLLRSYLILIFVESIPTAMLDVYGPQGSGKTFRLKIIREIADPSELKILSLGTNKKELIQQVSHHYLPVYDNVTNMNKEISDFFCRIVTGEGDSKRELFSNDEDVIYSLKRKVIFNGINIVGQEADFLDRTFTLKFERISKEKRRTEKELLDEFEQDKAIITGAIIKLLQKTLAIVDDVKLKELPRMADYCKWGEASARAYGEEHGTFVSYFFDKIEKLNTEVLDASPIGVCIKELMDTFEGELLFVGTPTELYEKLKTIAEKQGLHKTENWPKGANSLTRRLNEIVPNLQDEGYIVTTGVRIGMKRGIRIEQIKKEEGAEK